MLPTTRAVSAISAMPVALASACGRIAAALQADVRLDALLLAGSAIDGAMDAQSDLDFVVVCAEPHYATIMQQRREIAAGAGTLLAAFSGEHVGEPRLLICLYADPLLHVDFKFVTAAMLSSRVEDPLIVWSRCESVAGHLADGSSRWPNQAPEWFEERFWIWLHYAASKHRRGEMFETVAMLSFLREQILGPLIARARGKDQRGLRRIEHDDAWTTRLKRTLAGHDAGELGVAVAAAAELYLQLRNAHRPLPHNLDAAREALVLDYVRSG